MKITGARVALNADVAAAKDFWVRDGRISFASGTRKAEAALDLSGLLILPGLINAHDHLEFNLFPPMGRAPYSNAKAWAEDVYHPTVSPLKEHLAVRKDVRLMWGGLKTLLSGVTTVAHHNPYEPIFDDPGFPVHVLKHYGWAHSIDFSADLQNRYCAAPRTWPFFIHAAEGIDSNAQAEIGQLDGLGLLSDRTVLIHAIGAKKADLDLLMARGTSIVWCPSSNLTLYGKTLDALTLQSGLPLALGTDSAMTGCGDLLDEIALARRHANCAWKTLYDMVTVSASSVLHLKEGEGTIRNGAAADFIAVKDCGVSPAQTLAALDIQLVSVGGEVKLASPEISRRHQSVLNLPYRIEMEQRGQWLTSVNLPALHAETEEALGAEFRLAGKRINCGSGWPREQAEAVYAA